MTIKAMANACEGIYHGNSDYLEKEVSSITIDSRTVEQNSLFIAIKGTRSDGHQFISDCYAAGALCCISEKELEGETRPYIQVESSLTALKKLAEFYRSNLDVKVIGITGSVGKTSTKETIASVLATKYRVLKTQGNFNNEIGLPLTIFRIKEEDEIAVLEMGISDFGEMTRLSKIAHPDICVITNIGMCHLEQLKTREGVLKAKTEIFKYMNPDGIVILNGDDDQLITVKQVYDKTPVFFGIENKDDIYCENVVNNGLRGMQCTMRNVPIGNKRESFPATIPIPGYHMVYNALAAVAVGAYLGLSTDDMIQGLLKIQTLAGRNHIIDNSNFLIIDDCYNANPISMKASIDVLQTAVGRKVCILGSMFELGEQEKQLHYNIGTYVAEQSMDVLVTVGELAAEIAAGAKDYISKHCKAYHCEIYSYADLNACMESIGQILLKDDNILIKASHGMEFPKLVEAIEQLDLRKNGGDYHEA